MLPDNPLLTLPSNTSIAGLFDDFATFLNESGAVEVIGGPEVLGEGIAQLKAGAIVLASELTLADQQRVPLATAVCDTERFPHLARLHGYFENLLTAEIPAELLPWVNRLVNMALPPRVASMRRTVVAAAVHDANPMCHALARLAVFEAACLQQRVALLRKGTHLAAMGGGRRDVELFAERELEALDSATDYRRELLRLEDPLGLIQRASNGMLEGWIEILMQELRGVRREVLENLEWRQTLLTVADLLGPRDRAIFMNDAAGQFDEERLAPEQLLRLNPIHLAGLGDAGVRQRRARLKTRLKSLLESDEFLEGVEPPQRATTLGSLVIEALNEVEAKQ